MNDTTVFLADSDFGNINMTLTDFTAAFIQETINSTGYGYVLVVTNDTNNPQLSNSNALTVDEMMVIKGTFLGLGQIGNFIGNAVKSFAGKVYTTVTKVANKVYTAIKSTINKTVKRVGSVVRTVKRKYQQIKQTVEHEIRKVENITPVSVYNYVSLKINWHLFKKDNSYQKGTYSQSNYYIKTWANDIKNKYPLNNNQEKGEAVFKYVFNNVVTKWQAHYNTACPIQDVAKYHEADCAESARITYNLCLKVGIPKNDVRYVHSASNTHYWVQIRCNGKWKNCDPSRAYKNHKTYPVTKFGDWKPAPDWRPIPEGDVA